MQQATNYLKLIWFADIMWIWEITFAKISIAFTFLRLHRDMPGNKLWMLIMWATITYLAALAVIVTIFELTYCKPIHLYWQLGDKGRNDHCKSFEVQRNKLIISSVIVIASDLQLSLLPLVFISQLRLPKREKFFMGALMVLGFWAAIAGSLKFINFNKRIYSPDFTYNLVLSGLGAVTEANVAIIASCLPPLKSSIDRVYKRVKSKVISHRNSRNSSNSSDSEERSRDNSVCMISTPRTVSDALKSDESRWKSQSG
jgi:hypothetical protein